MKTDEECEPEWPLIRLVSLNPVMHPPLCSCAIQILHPIQTFSPPTSCVKYYFAGCRHVYWSVSENKKKKQRSAHAKTPVWWCDAAAVATFFPLLGFHTVHHTSSSCSIWSLITNDPHKHCGLGFKRQRGEWKIEFNPATQGKGDLSASYFHFFVG